MTKEESVAIIAKWKTFFGPMASDVETVWNDELIRQRFSFAEAKSTIESLAEEHDPAGRRRFTFADFAARYKERNRAATGEKQAARAFGGCDRCGSRGRMAIVLCGPNPGLLPCRLLDSRDSDLATMERNYWLHTVPCISCERGQRICEIEPRHAGLRNDRQRWADLCNRAMTWTEAETAVIAWQHYADHQYRGKDLPWWLTTASPPPESVALRAKLEQVAARIVEYSRQADVRKREIDIVEEAKQ